MMIMQGVMIICWLSSGHIESTAKDTDQVNHEADPKDSWTDRKLTICENLCHMMKK